MHRFICWETVFGDTVHHEFQTQVFFQNMHKLWSKYCASHWSYCSGC